MDDTVSEIFIKESAERFKLRRGERVESAKGQRHAFLKINVKVIGAVRRQAISLNLVEHICIFMVDVQNA